MEKYKRVEEMTLEEKRQKVAKFNVMDDVFFQKMMEDKEVCEEILRIILDDSKLQVVECVPQASIKNIIGKSVVLDVLCRDETGKYYNIEVQKADDDDHQQRVRYNGALATTFAMRAGEDYKQMPDVRIVFISRFDVFRAERAMYHVDRVVRETGQIVDNGQSEIYVNAKVDDGTPVAELMNYFKKSEGRNDICPKLSERVKIFKTEQKEVTAMCELMEMERLAGREEGREEGRITERTENILRLMEKMGISFEQACDIQDIPSEEYEFYEVEVGRLKEKRQLEKTIYRGNTR